MDLKNVIIELKNLLVGCNRRFKPAEERISKLESMPFEIIESEEKKEKKKEKQTNDEKSIEPKKLM